MCDPTNVELEQLGVFVGGPKFVLIARCKTPKCPEHTKLAISPGNSWDHLPEGKTVHTVPKSSLARYVSKGNAEMSLLSTWGLELTDDE